MPRPSLGQLGLCLVNGSLLMISITCGGGGGGNNAPKVSLTWNSTPKTAATEAHPYRYVASASSTQGGSPQFTLTSAPSGATLIGSTLDWTPTSAQNGSSQSFRIKAEDGANSLEQAWSVTVSANAAPTFTSVPTASGKEGHSYAYTLAATDADGDAVQFAATQLPTGATLNGAQLAWTPATSDVGKGISFTVTASDAYGGHTDQSWIVTPIANAAPVFSSLAPSTGKEGHAYAYAPAAVDADGDAVQFVGTQLPVGATLNGAQLTWTPAASDAGKMVSFTLTAQDAFGGHTDQSWIVTPTANALPVFTSQPPVDVSFVQGAPAFDYALTGTDADNDVVTFSLIQSPAGTTLVNGIIHWQPTPDQERLPQIFQIRASDGHGGATDQQWTKAYSGVLRGTWADSYQAPSGAITTKQDTSFALYPLKALIPDGTGGVRTLNGILNPDGSMRLSGIPPGSYWLSIGSRGWVWTDQSSLDIGKLYLGRTDALSSNDPAPLSLTLSGLDSWSDINGMRWVVPNQDVQIRFDSQAFTTNPPAPGDTALVSAVMPRIPYTPLVDATKQDELTLLQLGHDVQGPLKLETIAKAFTTTNLVQVAGTTTALSGTFSTPLTSAVDLVWNPSLDATFLNQVHPGSTSNAPYLIVATQPGGTSSGLAQRNLADLDQFYWSHPVVLTAEAASFASFQQPLTYGDPYPASWPRMFISTTTVVQDFKVNGISGATAGYLMTVLNSPGTLATPLQTLVSPVRNPTINGQDFFLDQSGVGTTPMLTWDPPALGSSALYQIRINELIPNSSGFSMGRLFTQDMTVFGTSIQVPPGFLNPGSIYLINIRAVSCANPGIKNAPFRMALPLGMADCLSGVIRP